MREKFGVRGIAQAGVLAALVCAASWIRFDVPSPVGNTAYHLGNVMCVLSGLLIGPWGGGMAAGIGSGLFDLLNPKYIASAPFTLVFKFFIGFLAGTFAYAGGKRGEDWRKNLIGGVLGSLVYIILYLGRTYVTAVYVNLMQPGAALLLLPPKLITSSINAVISVTLAVSLAPIIQKGLRTAGLRK